MKFSSLKMFFLSGLFLALFSLGANAQVCGKFKVTVNVQDANGKPVENAVVQLLPITKDETGGKQFVRDAADLSTFFIQYTEGTSLREVHRLIVSADGYKTAENEIKFVSCQGPRITIKLPKKDSEALPVWEFKTHFMIYTKDSSGKDLRGFRLIIKKDGKIVDSTDMESYGIGFGYPNGEYVFRIEKDGYEPKEIKVDLTKIVDVEVIAKLKPKT